MSMTKFINETIVNINVVQLFKRQKPNDHGQSARDNRQHASYAKEVSLFL